MQRRLSKIGGSVYNLAAAMAKSTSSLASSLAFQSNENLKDAASQSDASQSDAKQPIQQPSQPPIQQPSQQPQVPAVEKDDGPSSHVHFADSPCNTCENPCAEHPQLPDYLAKKIDQDLPLEGTMKPYAQHILIRVGKGRSWADDLDSTPDSFVVRVAQAVSAKKLPFRTLITAFESNDDVEGLEETAEQAQVVFYPQSLAMDRLAVADIAAAIDWLAGTVNAPSSVQTPATASAIIASAPEALAASTGMRVWHHKTTLFVCTHKRRDKRCGVAGPMLVDEFTKAFGEMGLTSQDVGVYGVSHFGGHKFAGNVIVYHGEADGSVVGDWLGRVRTCHVRPILATTVQQGKIFRELWRGRMDALPVPKPSTPAW